MNSPAHLLFGIDPDVFCNPDHFDLHVSLSLTRGSLIADFPSASGRSGFAWKKSVAELARKRVRNKLLSEMQCRRIETWLERNRFDYKMLPPMSDPRFGRVDCEWKSDWGWQRNAAASLQGQVAAVISTKECEEGWVRNTKWRRLDPEKPLVDCVPEINEEEREGRVKRCSKSLASLVAHPLQFGNVLKLIDPYADFECWHPTLDAMLESAKFDLSIELHCARMLPKKRPDGPSKGSREAWITWAAKHHSSKLHKFRVFYWELANSSKFELHDRYAIVGGELADGSLPFAGIGVGKGWDQAPSSKREVETSFWHVSGKDQKVHWDHYSEQSKVLKRDPMEDVVWLKNR